MIKNEYMFNLKHAHTYNLFLFNTAKRVGEYLDLNQKNLYARSWLCILTTQVHNKILHTHFNKNQISLKQTVLKRNQILAFTLIINRLHS